MFENIEIYSFYGVNNVLNKELKASQGKSVQVRQCAARLVTDLSNSLPSEMDPDEATPISRCSAGEVYNVCRVYGGIYFLHEPPGSEVFYIKIGLVPHTALWGGWVNTPFSNGSWWP